MVALKNMQMVKETYQKPKQGLSNCSAIKVVATYLPMFSLALDCQLTGCCLLLQEMNTKPVLAACSISLMASI